MDFAKRQLEKYGWCEGQGLGKNSTGIKTALKPKVKLNTAGIGHDAAQEFTYRWWEDAFNNAASNINIELTKDGVTVETVVDDSPEISAVKRARIKRDKMQYGAFVKRETLTKSGCVLAPEDTANPIEVEESRLPTLPNLNDEELFQACGGLTAHKAARHGHKLSGKLQRVKEQEEALLKRYHNTEKKEIEHIDRDICNEARNNKKKRNKDDNLSGNPDSSENVWSSSKKKRHKAHKADKSSQNDQEITVNSNTEEVVSKQTVTGNNEIVTKIKKKNRNLTAEEEKPTVETETVQKRHKNKKKKKEKKEEEEEGNIGN